MNYNKEAFNYNLDKHIKHATQRNGKLVLNLSGTTLSKIDQARKIEGNKFSRVEFITSLIEYYFQ